MIQLNADERRRAVQLALGRIFRIMSRPAEPGDAEQYEAARQVVIECAPALPADWIPNYARDRNSGAQGD